MKGWFSTFVLLASAARIPARLAPCLGAAALLQVAATDARAGQYQVHALQVGGQARQYKVYVPDGRAPKAPVVLSFHGLNSRADQMRDMSRLNDAADAGGFLAVFPEGVGWPGGWGQSWNAGGGCCWPAALPDAEVDDVGFARAVLDDLDRRYGIDADRVFAAGFSNGGFFASRLACELADRVAAAVVVEGGSLAAPCAPARPVPIVFLHGTADGVVPYDGGVTAIGIPVDPITTTANDWRLRNGCGASSATTSFAAGSSCAQYRFCDLGADTQLCTVPGLAHAWPHDHAVAGESTQATDVDATGLAWAFFSAHPMPPRVDIDVVRRRTSLYVPPAATGAEVGFGFVVFGGSSSVTLDIHNLGWQAPLRLTGVPKVTVSPSTAGFSVLVQPAAAEAAPRESSWFRMGFSPRKNGAHFATVTIQSNDPAEPAHTFTVGGYGFGAPLAGGLRPPAIP